MASWGWDWKALEGAVDVEFEAQVPSPLGQGVAEFFGQLLLDPELSRGAGDLDPQ